LLLGARRCRGPAARSAPREIPCAGVLPGARSFTEEIDILRVTLRAHLARMRRAAIVALQRLPAFVVGIEMLQLAHCTEAPQLRKARPRISAAVDQNKNLRLKQQALVNPRVQQPAKSGWPGGSAESPGADASSTAASRTILHRSARVSSSYSVDGVMIGLERGRRGTHTPQHYSACAHDGDVAPVYLGVSSCL